MSTTATEIPKSQYEALGVDSGKKNVHATFKPIINNDFPGSFVNIIYDPNTTWWDRLVAKFSPGRRRVLTQHPDGDGSKSIQRILHWLVTWEAEQIGYALDDAMAMNGSDIAASGFVFRPWIITQVLNFGSDRKFKEIAMASLRDRWYVLRNLYAQHGFQLYLLGGETADLPDQVRTAVYDMTVNASGQARHVIKGNVRPGDKIWGFASDGQAVCEAKPNSGIMANGLTMARSVLMSTAYNDLIHHKGQGFDLSRNAAFFKGRFKVNDKPDVLNGLSVSQALLSPTRQWPLLIRQLLLELRRRDALHLLHGISINTGGGATKIRNLGRGDVLFMKEKMPEPPPLFRLIQAESGESWNNMYQTFNCGVGVDIIGEEEPELSAALEKVAGSFGVALYELGYCFSAHGAKHRVSLCTPYGEYNYD